MKPILERYTLGEILELPETPDGRISLEVAKKNYKRLIKQYHPDVNKSAEAVEYTKRLNKAYAIVMGKEPLPQQPIPPQPQPRGVIIRYSYGGFGFSSNWTSGTSTTGWY